MLPKKRELNINQREGSPKRESKYFCWPRLKKIYKTLVFRYWTLGSIGQWFLFFNWRIITLWAQMVKNLPAMQETWVWSLGFKKIPWRREWQPTPVFLPGESQWTEEPGGLQSMGLQRVGHEWAIKHSTITLQYCVGFCFTTTWISHKYAYVPSVLRLPPTPSPSHPSRLSQNTRLSCLCNTAASH